MFKIYNHQALLGFSHFSKIGPQKIIKLEKYFGSPAKAFWASALELERAGINSPLINEFTKWRANFNPETVEASLKQEQIEYITYNNIRYPSILKEIAAPPYIIYYRGNVKLLSAINYQSLAVVGSRKHSAYGEKIISNLLPAVIENRIMIISGLALGIDALAHKIALGCNGATIAVLGSGLDRASIYPPANRSLAAQIINSGNLLISEFPPLTPPLKQNFPQRNRIISGLCQATLVIEADLKSGSLITANYALEQNREVLAIPGNIFSDYSCGTNNLLKLGAKTITEASDILEIFDIETAVASSKKRGPKEKILFSSEPEKVIYQIISRAHERGEKISIDEIINLSKLDTSVINSTLTILELRGVAKYDGIGYDIN